MHAVTNKRLATVPDAERALFAIAISAARNAFSAWDAVPFARRKAILAGVLNKMDDDADELSALLTAEQRITLAEARWEINLLIKAFGPALLGSYEKASGSIRPLYLAAEDNAQKVCRARHQKEGGDVFAQIPRLNKASGQDGNNYNVPCYSIG